MKDTKRQVFPAGLWVIATPIGNLDDLTLRARWALEEADWILCEDTRRTQQLMTAIGLVHGEGRLRRVDAHADDRKIHDWLEELQNGRNVALVTDAGTPAISDPGSMLVAAAHHQGIRVTPVPGVSAVPTLLSVAGFSETSFTFRGFFPRKKSEQVSELKLVADSPISRVFVWFESPQRILEAVQTTQELFPEAVMIVGKELTKKFEKLFFGTSTQILKILEQEISQEGKIGEWCFAIQFQKLNKYLHEDLSPQELQQEMQKKPWFLALQCIIESGVSNSVAVKKVSQSFGIPKNEIYDAALRISGKK